MTTYGTLYGIGVGPGAPDLMTLRAVNILSRVKLVFAASSTKNDASVALSIAREHLGADVEIQELGFPMTRDSELLDQAWTDNANRVQAHLQSGEDAAFLTLGDSLLYSTFGYMLSTLKEKWPTIPIEVVPGITSFQAAAAQTGTILVESGQSLQIVSGISSEEDLRKQLSCAENIVILKAYRNLPVIRKVLEELGLTDQSILATRIGQAGEKIMPLREAPEKPHYFSLILITSADRSGAMQQKR